MVNQCEFRTKNTIKKHENVDIVNNGVVSRKVNAFNSVSVIKVATMAQFHKAD